MCRCDDLARQRADAFFVETNPFWWWELSPMPRYSLQNWHWKPCGHSNCCSHLRPTVCSMEKFAVQMYGKLSNTEQLKQINWNGRGSRTKQPLLVHRWTADVVACKS